MSYDAKEIERFYALSTSTDPADTATFETECARAVPQFLSAMQQAPDDSVLQSKCICILKEFCFENDANAQYLAETEALSLALKALNKFLTENVLVVHAFGFFVNLSVVEKNRNGIAQGGGIHTTIRIMGRSPAELELQILACMVLRNVSCDNEGNQKIICDFGGVAGLLNACERFSTKEELVNQAVAALLHISHSDEGKTKIGAENGVPILFKLCNEELSDSVKEDLLALFVNLSLSNEVQHILIKESICPFLFDLLKTQTDPLQVQRTIQILGNISCTDSLRDEVVRQGALEVVVKNMVQADTDPNSIRIAAWAILNMLTNSADAQALFVDSLEGLDAVLNLLDVHANDPGILMNGCKVLWTLGYSSADLQERIARDGMLHLLGAMQKHSADTELVFQLISLLVNLTLNEKTHSIFHAEDGLQVIADLFKAAQNSPATLSRCCRVLINVASIGSKKQVLEVVDRGFSELILNAMKSHKSDNDLQMKTCKLLSLLTGHEPTVSDRMVEMNGVQTVVETALANWQEVDLLKYYFSVLLNITMSDNTHTKFTLDQGLDLILRAMKDFPSLLEIQSRCCRTLGNLAGNDNYKVSLLGTDFEAFAKVMLVHGHDEDMQMVCSWILDELSSNENQLELLSSATIIEAVVMALTNHPNNSQVHRHGLETLYNFSASPQKNIRGLLGPKVVELAVQDLTNKPPDVSALACALLGNLADVTSGDVEASVIKVVLDLLNTFPDDPRVQVEGVSCLCKIAVYTGDWSVLGGIGGLEALIRLQHQDKHLSIQLACARAFHALSTTEVGTNILMDNNASGAIIDTIDSNSDVIAIDPCLVALSMLVNNSQESKLKPKASELMKLAVQLLTKSANHRILAGAAVLVGNLCARGFKDASAASHLVRCIEMCPPTDTNYDVYVLRLVSASALACLLAADGHVKAEIVAQPAVVDSIWASATELIECQDVHQQHGLSETSVELCHRGLDILLESHITSKDKRLAAMNLEMRQAHRQAARESAYLKAAKDELDYEQQRKSDRKREFRDDVPSAEQGISDAIKDPDHGAKAAIPGPEHDRILDQQMFQASREQEDRDAAIRDAMHLQQYVEAKDQMHQALLSWEEHELWERGQLEVDQNDGRRRLEVRMAQHRKALDDRQLTMQTLMHSWYSKLVDETSQTADSEEALKVGTQYLREAEVKVPPRRRLEPKFPPKPVEELLLFGRAEPEHSPEMMPNTDNTMSTASAVKPQPSAATKTKKKQPKSVMGWEALVCREKKKNGFQAASDSGMEGTNVDWSDQSLGLTSTTSADKLNATLPGYIYTTKNRDASYAVHPPGADSPGIGDTFRSVNVTSTLAR